MSGDSPKDTHNKQDTSTPQLDMDQDQAQQELLAGEKLLANLNLENESKRKQSRLTLSSSSLLASSKSEGLSVETKQGIVGFAGTLTAGVTGTLAWSFADKALGSNRYGLAVKAATAFAAGGLARVCAKGLSEQILLESKDRSTGWKDFALGGVDALAAVGAVKAEEKFSKSFKLSLGKSSGAHLSAESMIEQGERILAGSLSQRIGHNTMRGIVGGGTGAFLWSTPNVLLDDKTRLDSLAGWKEASDKIVLNTALGAGFGGGLYAGGTALWNLREIAGHTKAAILGDQGRYSLSVYHFNDGHSSLLGPRSTLPQLAGKAESLREANKKAGISSVVLDLGDAHSGNAAAIISNTGEVEQRLIHQHLKVNASVPGNHSADTGLPGNARDVGQWIANMKAINSELSAVGREAPGVAANMQSLLDPAFAGAQGIYKPYRVFVDPKSGDKVGMVGLVTDQLQSTTPKLIDMDLAVLAGKYGDLSFRQLTTKLSSDPSGKQLLERISANSTLQKLGSAAPENIKVKALVDQVLDQSDLAKLSLEARQSYRNWFAMAKEHPDAKLSELAGIYTSNEALKNIARAHPEKTIAELNQIMISDPQKALAESVAALKAEGIDKVIVLSHLGKTEDLALAAKGPRVAAILGGHSHDLEPRPLFVKNTQSGSDVLVSQAGSGYGWLGESKLVFNKDGSINRYLSSGRLHVIDERVKPLPSAYEFVKARLQENEAGRALLHKIDQRHPVTISAEMSLDNLRGQKGVQTPLANLIAAAFKEGGDQMLPVVNSTRQAKGLPPLANNVEVVLIQSGGIRAGLPAGQLDELTLQSMFMNRPTLMELSGDQIQKVLSYGVHDFPAAKSAPKLMDKAGNLVTAFSKNAPPMAQFDASGKSSIVGQLRYKIDRSLPSNQRAIDIEVFDQALGRYLPLDPARRYTVISNSHLINKVGNTPLIPAAQLRGRSLQDLGPEYWVLGKRMEAAAVAAQLKPSELPQGSSRDFMLSYLQSRSSGGKFHPAAELLESPLKDISPGAWVPELRPTPSLLSPAILSAHTKDAPKK